MNKKLLLGVIHACLLTGWLLSLGGCKKEETEEETPAAAPEISTSTPTDKSSGGFPPATETSTSTPTDEGSGGFPPTTDN